ncbi:cytochrome P450 [Kibdelosporangium persicum]|uniref:Erythromycin C-12 hydroxylase n=1 Tax=Kibdelosporangium persicum TaxID=2698649 RepID=A0ABX2FD55_9PSEU|nr:cytochrome P450 [Kibdelosporangium persicum]NRN68806.1 Erythromycin C-12 hydroxylase [Kibdelosporangium persicum]
MAADGRKVDRGPAPAGCPVQHNPDGTWQINGYVAGRAFLRDHDTVQAGLGIETVEGFPEKIRRPVLYRDGPEHREHRKQTARFFTPRRVDEAYRTVMERVADEQIALLRKGGAVHLADMSFQVAVDVTSAVIGLTNSKPGIKQRLDYFFPEKFGTPGFTSLHGLYWVWRQLRGWSQIYFADVRPAVRARRAQRRDDLISHLIDEGCSAAEILGECLTFAAAGMVTTREFIVMAAWHMFTNDEVRATYVAADEPERLSILHEVLRLEPVLGHLKRRTTKDIQVDSVTVPSGSVVRIQIDHANLDTEVVGEEPLALRPGRSMAHGGSPTGLSFGDGPHKCPGSHIAIMEADIFLHRMFSLDGIRMVQPPRITFKEDIAGYELRGMQVAAG